MPGSVYLGLVQSRESVNNYEINEGDNYIFKRNIRGGTYMLEHGLWNQTAWL